MSEESDASDVSLSGETFKGLVGQALMAVTGFLGTIIFARILGQEALGSFYLIFALMQLFERPIGGMGTASKKRASESDVNESEIVGAQAGFNGLWFATVAVVLLLLSNQLATLVGVAEAALLLVLLLATEAVYGAIVPIIESKGRIGLSFGLDTLRSYVTLPLQLLFVFAGLDVYGMVFGLAGGTLFAIPVALWYHRVEVRRPTDRTIRRLVAYAKYSIPTVVLAKAYERFDTLLLGFLLSQSAVANYGVAARVTLPAIFVASAASGGLFVRVSNLRSKGEAVGADVSNTLAFSSILAVPLLFGGAAIAKPLVVTLFGAEFAAAAPLVVGLAAYRLLQSQSTALERVIDGLDLPRYNFWLSVLTLAINIVLGVFLTLRIGALGVVVSTVIAEGVRYCLQAYWVKTQLPSVSLLSRPLLEQLAAGTAMFLVVSGLLPLVMVHSWVDLVFFLLAGAGTYCGLLVVISPLTRTTVREVLLQLGLIDEEFGWLG